LEHKEHRDRSVIDSQPLRAEPILYQLERARCPRCGKTVQARAPEVLPKSLYGNQLVTQVVFPHYRQGIPMGRLCDQPGIGLGAVVDILHRMAALFRGVMGKLVEDYRQAPVRHADETGWRTDVRSGYAFGADTKEAKEFPGETGVTAFTSTLIPLLAEAMHLRGRPLADAGYADGAIPHPRPTVADAPVCPDSTPSPRLRDYGIGPAFSYCRGML
jgi:hypothetical protein